MADLTGKTINWHDRIRSAGVILSIVFSLTAIYLQLRPKPENVSLDAAEIVWLNEPMEFRQGPPLPLGNRSLIGPIYWRITFNNKSDHAVSFKRTTALVSDQKLGTYFASGIYDGVWTIVDKSSAMPFTIPGYESKSIVIRGFLPGWVTISVQARCLKKGISLQEFQRCAIHEGIDFFGNKLTVYRDADRFLAAGWPDNSYQPKLIVSFVSGSNTVYKTEVTMIPIMSM